MSIEKIVENIQNNILGRHGADEVLRALELVTKMPVTFKKMVDAGVFFATHHDVHDGCPTGDHCDDCYSGDTEFDHACDMSEAAVTLFKHMDMTENDMEEGEESSDENLADNPMLEMTEQLPLYPNMGFRNPKFLSDNMVGFLREADLDLSLLATESGICTIAVLMPLLNIYARRNNMQKDPDNKQFLTATPLMHKWFGETTFKEIQKRQKQKRQQQFYPEKFRFSNLSSICSLNIKRDDLSKEQLDHLYSEEILERLKKDQVLVSNTLRKYRESK